MKVDEETRKQIVEGYKDIVKYRIKMVLILLPIAIIIVALIMFIAFKIILPKIILNN